VQAKILLLEDDQLFGETLVDFLEDEGYLVYHYLEAKDVCEATFKEKFDIYLLDVNVPDMNGFDLLKQLRESGDRHRQSTLHLQETKRLSLQGFTRVLMII